MSYALQIAEGLSRAHGAGIVHRDLKPKNVMVTDDRLVKILDFGVAKIGVDTDAGDVQTEAPLTRAGASVGTLGYMSPEQALGAPVDARSDVFSFGVILFELLTKQRPFAGASASDVLHSLHFAEPPIGRIPSSVPRRVVAVIRKCLAKQPPDRYRTMADVAEVLRAIAIPIPDPVFRPSQPASMRWSIRYDEEAVSSGWPWRTRPRRRADQIRAESRIARLRRPD